MRQPPLYAHTKADIPALFFAFGFCHQLFHLHSPLSLLSVSLRLASHGVLSSLQVPEHIIHRQCIEPLINNETIGEQALEWICALLETAGSASTLKGLLDCP